MKFTSCLVAVSALLTSQALAGPLIQRNSTDVVATVSSLVADAEQHSQVIINATTHLSSKSTAAENSTTEALISANIQDIHGDLKNINTAISSTSLDASQQASLEEILTQLTRGLEYTLDILLTILGLEVVEILLVPVNGGLNDLVGGLGTLLDDLLKPSGENSSTTISSTSS